MELQIARHRLQVDKVVREVESGKPDTLKNKQDRRKNKPRAAEKRTKHTERHLGDA